MGKLRKLLGILLLSLLLLSGCAGDKTAERAPGPEGSGGASSEPSAGASLEPSADPVTFTGTDMAGNTVSSDVLAQSKLTMINVWATYCGPCLREMPALGQLAADYDTEEFQIIGIISDVSEGEDQSTAESLIQQTGADYTHLLLNDSVYFGLLTDVTAVPTTFFLDRDGNILDTVVGAMEQSAWKEKIDGLLEAL